MKLAYKLAANKDGVVDAETLRLCDDGAKAMGRMLRITARIIGGWPLLLLILLPSYLYFRTVTKESISYDFFLIPLDTPPLKAKE